MNTKTILKTLALAMMMPAMLLTTACSSSDDDSIINDETPAKKGYTIPVTINVTRQDDDATTRATYNGTSNKLEFSTGDKLFVSGSGIVPGAIAGTLTWQEGTKFKGTITTQNEYSGTADELFSKALFIISAQLLPAGYAGYDFLTYTEKSGYDATTTEDFTKAIVTSTTEKTAKALAVEQFSNEYSQSYSNGFALSPRNAILNFTITGLAPSTNVEVVLTVPGTISGNSYNITKQVTSDASGNATFAVGVEVLYPLTKNLKDFTLTVGGYAITITSSNKKLEQGHIYNITRSASPLANVTNADLGKVIGANGKIYANAADATAASTTAVAMIAYVGSATGETSYTHGLALALKDANNGSTCLWSTSTSSTVHAYCTTNSSDFSSKSESGLQYNNSSYNPNHNTDEYPAFKAAMAYNSSTAPTNCSAWFLPTCYQLQLMIDACKNVLGTNGNFTDLRDAFNGVGGENMKSSPYWLATEYEAYYAWRYLFDNGTWSGGSKNFDFCVRSAIAF